MLNLKTAKALDPAKNLTDALLQATTQGRVLPASRTNIDPRRLGSATKSMASSRYKRR
jgi:hypothetical protein